MSEPIVYTLRSPITVGGETITELTIREPKVKELRRAQLKGKDSMEVMIILLTLVGGISEAAVNEMAQTDWFAVQEVFEGFTVGGPAAGAVASLTSPDGSVGAPSTATA